MPTPIGGKASIEFGENEDFGEKFGEKGDDGRPEFGENEDFGENPTQQKIIAIMRLAPTKSAKAIAEETGMTTRGIEKNIRELKKMGLVERIGSAKGGHWVVCSR